MKRFQNLYISSLKELFKANMLLANYSYACVGLNYINWEYVVRKQTRNKMDKVDALDSNEISIDKWASWTLAITYQLKNHRDAHMEVLPIREVVPCPSCSISLTTNKASSSKNKRTLIFISQFHSFICGPCHQHAINLKSH